MNIAPCSKCQKPYDTDIRYGEETGTIMRRDRVCFGCAWFIEKLSKQKRTQVLTHKGEIYSTHALDRNGFYSGSYWGWVYDIYFSDGRVETMCLSHPNNMPQWYDEADSITKMVLHMEPIVMTAEEVECELCFIKTRRHKRNGSGRLHNQVIRYIDGKSITDSHLRKDPWESKLRPDAKCVDIRGWKGLIMETAVS